MAEKSPEAIAQERIEEARRTGATELDLSRFDLTVLPESIGQLEQLQELNLSGNGLTALPESIGQLAQLQVLNLNSNQLTILPESIGQLAQLQMLQLSPNKLTALPESIGQLIELNSLGLDGNRLIALPESIGQLTELRTLNVMNNRLTALPQSISELPRLEKLYLHGNDELGIPPEILGPDWWEVHRRLGQPANPSNILQYYFQTRREVRRRLGEAKILLVGQGGVGKTSLVKRLVDDQFDPDEAKTEGINISQWQVSATKGKEGGSLRVNVWDFGGQEIMHATHQFFLTKRSVYLVVLDARKGENESNIHYWLKIIQSYGGDSPVLVVTNKCDEDHLELNENRLTKDYAPNVQGFFKVSSKEGTGIQTLREAIEAQVNALPHVYDEVPESYFNVKAELEKRAESEDFIDIWEYRKLCYKHGLTKKQDQQILIRFLHDLGSVLNFDDPDNPYRLRDTNILNPEWVTGGVYKIINNIDLVRAQGMLKLSQLSAILDDHNRYPPERHNFIIGMMRKFELCFDFPDPNPPRLLIPELLPVNEPDLNWDDATSLNFQYHYKVLPGGIISRFIVRMHHNLTDKPTYWRSGVVLDIDGNKALVRGDTQAGKVFVSVQGPVSGRRRALFVIRDAFKAIHTTIPKIDAKEKVPLPDAPDIFEDYQHLLDLEAIGEADFLPRGLKQKVSVKALLDGVEPEDERQKQRAKPREDVRPSSGPASLPPEPEVVKEVFISYAWGGESEEIVNQLDSVFQEKGIPLVRDKRDLGFKGRIKAFMELIGRGKCVIVIISKKYLESENCMFELVEIAENGDFYDRIFPIVLGEAKIYKAIHRVTYIKHWEDQIQELTAALKEVGPANLPGLHKDIDLYTKIRHTIDGLTDILRDMNAPTAERNRASGFSELIDAVAAKLAE